MVEDAPAPLHPWSESAAISREPARGSPCRDDIDRLVDASIARGPKNKILLKCGFCAAEWHGLPSGECRGSHVMQLKTGETSR